MQPLYHLLLLLLLTCGCAAFRGPYCPIGVQLSTIIPSASITATSGTAENARLFSLSGGWIAATSASEYLQIDLGSVKDITGFATQGASNSWVSSLVVSVSTDLSSFQSLGTFSTNTDSTTTVSTLFTVPEPDVVSDIVNVSINIVKQTTTVIQSTVAHISARYIRFAPSAGSPSLPAPLMVDVYTPCTLAHFFLSPTMLGYYDTTLYPGYDWSLVPLNGITQLPDYNGTLPQSTTYVTTVQTGDNGLYFRAIFFPGVVWVGTVPIDFSLYNNPTMTAYVRVAGVATQSVVCGASGQSNVSQASLIVGAATITVGMQPITQVPFAIFRRPNLQANVTMLAVWISGSFKTCSQRLGMYSNNGCHLCDGITQYQDQAGQSSCKSVTSCPANSYQTIPATATTNRVCTPCTTTCADGTYLTGTCGGLNTTYCTSCSEYCGSCTNITYCSICKDFTYYRSLDSTQCLVDCPPGQYGVAGDNDLFCAYCDPTCKTCSNSDRFSCDSCGNTTFLDRTQSNTYGITTCDSVCPSGYYGNTDTRTCTSVTSCTVSSQYMIAAPTATSNRVCGSVTACTPGQYATAAPTSTSNRVCQNCSAGTTDLDSNYTTACVACPAGSYVPEKSFGPCSQFVCASGYSDVDYNPATACVQCSGPGIYVPANSSGPCNLYGCSAGKYDDDSSSATPCSTCPHNMFQPNTGQTSCNTCATAASCNNTQYVSSNCSAAADIQCAECTVCSASLGYTSVCRQYANAVCKVDGSSSASSSSDSSTAAIAGGVVGGVVALLLIGGIIYAAHSRAGRSVQPTGTLPSTYSEMAVNAQVHNMEDAPEAELSRMGSQHSLRLATTHTDPHVTSPV